MKRKVSSVLAIISSIVVFFITIFDYSHYSVQDFIILILPFLLFGIISYGILDLFNFKNSTKVIFTIGLTIILVVVWFFLTLLIHGFGPWQ